MSVILTTPEEWRLWLSAEPHDGLKLQRLLSDTALKIVAISLQDDWPPGCEPPPTAPYRPTLRSRC
jgi:putative SOS response-associated peptidase YedK